MSRNIYIVAWLVVLVVSGCASVPSGSRIATATKVDEAAVNALYAELEQAGARYEAGMKSTGPAEAVTPRWKEVPT